jgi:hypothetical protein
MILLDLNQTMISNAMAQLGNHINTLEMDLFRHMVLNSIRSYIRKYGSEYGELVVACDDKKYWRKQVFPHYKSNRKKAREESDVDWNQIFNCLNTIRDELKQTFPYRVIQVEGAEADDIIATLCMQFGSLLRTKEKILILSGDKDFTQLQVYANVDQYDPVQGKAIKTADPHKFLREHILKGDRGDGVPNILSPDDCFVRNERQKPLSKKRIEQLVVTADVSTLLSEQEYKNFKRNEQLIDFHMVPPQLATNIMEKYEQEANKPRSQLLNYFIHHKLKLLTEHIDEF